jgi:hypothetical protein
MMALSLITAHLNYFRSVVPTPASKSAPGRELKRALIGGAGVRRLTIVTKKVVELNAKAG